MTRRSLFATFLGTFLAPIAAKFFPPPLRVRSYNQPPLPPCYFPRYRLVIWDDLITEQKRSSFQFDTYNEAFQAAIKNQNWSIEIPAARSIPPPRRADVGEEKSTRLPGPQGSGTPRYSERNLLPAEYFVKQSPL